MPPKVWKIRWKNQFKCKNNKFFHKSTCISQKSSNFVIEKQKRGAARRPKKQAQVAEW